MPFVTGLSELVFTKTTLLVEQKMTLVLRMLSWVSQTMFANDVRKIKKLQHQNDGSDEQDDVNKKIKTTTTAK